MLLCTTVPHKTLLLFHSARHHSNTTIVGLMLYLIDVLHFPHFIIILSQVKMQTFPTLHTNLFKCSRHTFVKEGLRGFYSGTLPGALCSVHYRQFTLF